jgi:hypothetical protein
LQTLQSYIFRALQHFARNFTNFIMFFTAVVFDSLLCTLSAILTVSAGKCPAAPAAPLPGNF